MARYEFGNNNPPFTYGATLDVQINPQNKTFSLVNHESPKETLLTAKILSSTKIKSIEQNGNFFCTFTQAGENYFLGSSDKDMIKKLVAAVQRLVPQHDEAEGRPPLAHDEVRRSATTETSASTAAPTNATSTP